MSVAVALCMVPLAPVARAASAPDQGVAFEPRPVSAPIYADDAAREPWSDPALTRIVRAPDRVEILTETWLPVAKPGGPAPPEKVPTIVWPSPYNAPKVDNAPLTRPFFNSRGYAMTFLHLRGTGGSGGCFDMIGSRDIRDLELVLDDLATAPWFDGNIAMYGSSYEADAIMAVAGRGRESSTRHLKAIVPVDGNGGLYDLVAWDGVPRAPGIATGLLTYFNAVVPRAFSETMDPAHIPERAECAWTEKAEGARVDVDGEKNPFWLDREYRPSAKEVKAATFLVHGLASPERDTGDWFSQLPASTPKHLMVGQWEHTRPDWGDGAPYTRVVHPEWARVDFLNSVLAWFDQHLKGLDAGTDEWPVVEVQDSAGQWRAAKSWPDAGGRNVQLALSRGVLGSPAPAGSSSYVEPMVAGKAGQDAGLTFLSPPLSDSLHMTGRPVLDTYVRLDRTDAHLAARVDVLRRDGTPDPLRMSVGMRSAMHLDELIDDTFVQSPGTPVTPGTVVRVPVRFDPVDWKVEPGERVRLIVAGSVENDLVLLPPDAEGDPVAFATDVPVYEYDSQFGYTVPSGAGTTVEVLHDCVYPTALRFQLPSVRDTYLNVREPDEGTGALSSRPARVARADDGGGLATASVCE